MGAKTRNPHDAIVLDTFSQPEHAIGLLRAILPPAVAESLDIASAELSKDHFVDEKLRGLESDLLYRVATSEASDAFVYVLLEHQSTADRWMPFRLLRYMLRIWDRWHRNAPTAGLPPIVPVVLSHAPEGWTVARSLMELVEGPVDLLEALRPHLPDFEAIVEDLALRADDELHQMKTTALGRLVLLLLKHIRDGDIMERLPTWSETFRQVADASGAEALVRVLMYIVECVEDVPLDDLSWVEQAVGSNEGEVVMTLAERLREEGRREGLLQGRRDTVLKQLRLRFGHIGPAIETRLCAATAEELDALAEHILTAETLNDALAALD